MDLDIIGFKILPERKNANMQIGSLTRLTELDVLLFLNRMLEEVSLLNRKQK